MSVVTTWQPDSSTVLFSHLQTIDTKQTRGFKQDGAYGSSTRRLLVHVPVDPHQMVKGFKMTPDCPDGTAAVASG